MLLRNRGREVLRVKEDMTSQILADRLCAVLFRQPGPTRLLLLQKALSPLPVLPLDLLEETLESDPRFARCETRWDLAHRETSGQRPLGGALDLILRAYGRPMPRALLVQELCLTRPVGPEGVEELLDRLLLSGREIIEQDDLVALTAWLPRFEAPDERGLLFINDLASDVEFAGQFAKLSAATHKGRTPVDTAEAVLKAAKRPLQNRALGLVVQRLHAGRFNAADLLLGLVQDERFVALSGPRWSLASQCKPAFKALAEAAVEAVGEPTVDMAAILQGPAGQKLKLTAAASATALRLGTCSRTAVSLEELLADVMELRPRQRNYTPAAHALQKLLANEPALQPMGVGCFLSRGALPAWVLTVPESLQPQEASRIPGEEAVDTLLNLKDLPPVLAERVCDPFYEDEGELIVYPAQPEVEEIRFPLLDHHIRLGTLKYRQQDHRFFALPADLTVLTCLTPEGEPLAVWANAETRLLYGLMTWFAEVQPPCGALLTLRRVSCPCQTYQLDWEGETDPGTYIGRERYAQLVSLRTRLQARRVFLRDLVAEVLSDSDRGLLFDQLWSQVNVVRRTTRLQLASVLLRHERFTSSDNVRWKLG
jgi:hypothetical protein